MSRSYSHWSWAYPLCYLLIFALMITMSVQAELHQNYPWFGGKRLHFDKPANAWHGHYTVQPN